MALEVEMTKGDNDVRHRTHAVQLGREARGPRRVLAIGAVFALAALPACSTGGGGGGRDGGLLADGTGGVESGATGDGSGADSGSDGGADAARTDGGDGGACGSGSAAVVKHPSPIISRGAPAFASPSANARLINDGIYHNGGWAAGMPTAAAPAWVAIKLAAGPTRLLLSWDDGGTYNYQDTAMPLPPVYGLPSAYEIQVSADSTNGSDGTWTTARDASGNPVQVTGNIVRTRGHSFDFTGQSWIKMVITAAPANISANGVQIGEIDVHDLSAVGAGLPDDTWFFMGDSITAFAFDRQTIHQPSFAKTVNTESAAFYPAMINGGVGGEKSSDGLSRLQSALALNPDYRYFVLGYGTNDAGNGIPTATFQANMQMMVDLIKAAGKTPIVPHIPFAGSIPFIARYNTVIDQLVTTNNLVPGPDLYSYLSQHSSGGDAGTDDFICPPCAGGRLTDNLHPNDVGLTAINTLWAQAMCPLYP